MSEPEHVTSRQLLTALLSHGGLFPSAYIRISLTQKGTHHFAGITEPLNVTAETFLLGSL